MVAMTLLRKFSSNNTMITTTSDKKLGDKVVKIKAKGDLDECIKVHGKARIEGLFVGWAVAHSLAEGLKKAFSGEQKTEKAIADAKALVARVEAGEEFNVCEFLPKPRVDKVVLAIREKWEASEKKAAFLAHYGLDPALVDSDAEVVEQAYLASKDVSEPEL